MEIAACQSLVINAPEFFKDHAFIDWLNNNDVKFTWHRKGEAAGEWSDVVVCVDPGLTGEGSDSDMPDHIWDRIVDVCRERFLPRDGVHHIMVRLTNIDC